MKAILPWVLLGGIVVAWVASSVLAREDPQIAFHRDRADSLQTVNDSLHRADSLKLMAYSADSTRWAALLDSAQLRINAALVDYEAAGHRASEVATDLVARMDSTENALFAQFRADIASQTQSASQIITSLQTQLQVTTEDRDSLRVQLFGVRTEVTGLREENYNLREGFRLAEERNRRQARSSWIWKGATALETVVILIDAAVQ